ncbi:hypothetical protein G7Z17_g8786 [Cylindrodendrum hubeiense]|uniref:Peptidase M14 domain-containing protein n=1 Tax=Cylindrodendrum hubeiense TaxID=595255 RepID=A0A9P5H2W3_9HYPO|nr:hypothetical protein G7Z17_g8786 [Cylindrodendrum hubeiense]
MKLPLLTIAGLAAGAYSCLIPADMRPKAGSGLLHNAPVSFVPRYDIGIGSGDRFTNGTTPPAGLGIYDRDLKTILNTVELDSALRGLANVFRDVKLFDAPFTTFQNASLTGARFGDDPRVFIMSGVHARERGGPDQVIYFLSDLLHARISRSGIRYGNKSYSHKQVLTALSAGIVIMPLVNPDGVAHDQATDSCWRKNRNPASATRGKDVEVGVDLNRNFDFLWDYINAFSPKADLWAVASDDPTSEVFHGTAALSEPETQSVAWVLDSFPSLSWLLDVHSVGGTILYGWGDDNTQTSDSEQNFNNTAYDAKRGITGVDPRDSKYQEYMQASDVNAQRNLANRMKDAMASAGDTPYTVQESVSMYPTSGTSTDYALGRYYGRQCGANKVRGLTLEFGEMSTAAPCPFYPSKKHYHEWMREVGAGLMELMLNAAEEKRVETWEC